VKLYSACPRKLDARRETIIEPYRRHFQHSLSPDRQYWTMCASHTDGEGNILPGCELDEMLSEGLITPGQFNGVDIDGEIIDANGRWIPEVNWHHGDFHRAMVAAKNAGEFHPGIVNCDHLKMPQAGGALYVAKCLAFLRDQSDLIFVSNLIIKPPRNNALCSPEEYIDELWKHAQFGLAMESGWRHDDLIYLYGGTGTESRTWLGSMVFWK
jgi:hypothetical protein